MMHTEEPNKRHNQDNACLFAFADGCLVLDGCNNSDGCLSLDGCNPLDFDGCASVFFVPFRLLVILGLMLYGDWDYKNGCAKTPR